MSTKAQAPLDETLIDDIQAFLERFVVFPSPDHSLIVAYFVPHTWTIDAAHTTPYLYVNGEQASGKTRLLEMLELLCRTCRRTTSISAPAMYTLLRKLHAPTLLYDEIDTVWSRSSTSNQLTRNVCNAGYRRGGLIYRQRGDEVEEYDTFGPKVLAGIHNGHLPSTILSRCIPINMKPKRPDQKVERFIWHTVAESEEREELLSRIEQFSRTAIVDIGFQQPPLLGALSDRQNEIVEPLRQIAGVFGVAAERELSRALQTLLRESGAQKSAESELLERIKAAFDEVGTQVRGGERRIFSDDLCDALGRAWEGKPKQLSLWLARFGIQPDLIRIGADSRRGYCDSQFEAAWKEHLGEGLHAVSDYDEDEELEVMAR